MRQDRIRDQVLYGMRDRETRLKIVSSHNAGTILDLDTVVKMCRAAEKGKRTNEGLMQAERKEFVHAVTASAKVNKRVEDCLYCGRAHSNMRSRCPAYNRQCYQCGETGHFASKCKAKSGMKGSGINALVRNHEAEDDWQDVETGVAQISTFGHQTRNTELVTAQATIEGSNHKPVSMQFLPDTGASVDALDKDTFVNVLNGQISRLVPDSTVVKAINGEKLICLGKTKLTVQMNGASHKTWARIIVNLDGPVLSKAGCKTLGLVPKSFPDCNLLIGKISLDDNVCKQRVCVEDKNIPQEIIEEEKNKLLVRYADVFDSDAKLKPMKGPKMHIDLEEGAIPCRKTRLNRIPFHYQASVKQQLDDMAKQGIIERVPVGESTPWLHPMVVIPKKNTNEPRICVDLRGLNKYVKRPVHLSKTPRDAVMRIPEGMHFFTTMDSRKGFWQIELDDESKKLTAFLTPDGAFRFCRNIMGCSSAADEHNRRIDDAMSGIENIEVVVEDGVMFNPSFQDHLAKVEEVLQTCRKHGITLNKKKFCFAQKEVEWCGYTISSEGHTTSKRLVQSLLKFPRPKSKSDLRSFSGLVQQFEPFTPRLAETCQPLRDLLSKKTPFIWDQVREEAFQSVIQLLTCPRLLAQFNPRKRLRLETDAAQSKGLGYALWQEENDESWRLLQCGSRYTTPAESRYSATEIEMLAVVWAMKKCRMFI